MLPNTQFLVGRFNPYPEVKPGKRVVLEYFSCPFKCPNWDFLLEHQETFQSNPRMNLMLSNLCHLDSEERSLMRQESSRFLHTFQSE